MKISYSLNTISVFLCASTNVSLYVSIFFPIYIGSNPLHTNENTDKNSFKGDNIVFTEEDLPIDNKIKHKKDQPEDKYKKELTI
jgi:hypothetical protein